jgi:hypothetical protein
MKDEAYSMDNKDVYLIRVPFTTLKASGSVSPPTENFCLFAAAALSTEMTALMP